MIWKNVLCSALIIKALKETTETERSRTTSSAVETPHSMAWWALPDTHSAGLWLESSLWALRKSWGLPAASLGCSVDGCRPYYINSGAVECSASYEVHSRIFQQMIIGLPKKKKERMNVVHILVKEAIIGLWDIIDTL